jgi:hypothetical protein
LRAGKPDLIALLLSEETEDEALLLIYTFWCLLEPFKGLEDNFPREKLSIGQWVISSMFASVAVIGLSIGGAIIKHYG